jgi:hypothetical protein
MVTITSAVELITKHYPTSIYLDMLHLYLFFYMCIICMEGLRKHETSIRIASSERGFIPNNSQMQVTHVTQLCQKTHLKAYKLTLFPATISEIEDLQ